MVLDIAVCNTHTHTHTHSRAHSFAATHIVQTARGEGQPWLIEIFREDKCIEFLKQKQAAEYLVYWGTLF